MAAVDQMPAHADEITRLNSYVGFDTITHQIEHKLVKRGFQFNVIVVGACLSLGSPPLPTLDGPWALLAGAVLILDCRPDRSRQVDAHQHHLCLAPD